MNLKADFRRALTAAPERLHFAAHSHHLWPDVAFEAQCACWNDGARLADLKWRHVFAQVYPGAQRRVARVLGLGDPATLAFGPNTHGFVLRLLSCLAPGRPLRVLTTGSEFLSFARQMRRLEEDELVHVVRVPVSPTASFAERFAATAARGRFDLVYFSQVFYDSGFAVPDPAALVGAVAAQDAFVVVDGYHGFMARPSDLSAIEGRAFYLAGGYKYAMAGEGAAFLHAPPGYGARPRDTGWYAAFAALEEGADGRVAFPGDGARFLGATFDPVGLYRLNAVLDWLDARGVTVSAIHAHAHALQRRFIEALARLGLATLHPDQLIVPLEQPDRGNFLAFRTEAAARVHRKLLEENVVTDHRGDGLRIGFGVYHDEDDVERLCRVLGKVLA